MSSVVRYTIDTSFAVKGIVPPRRKKLDDILEKQQKMYKLARSYLNKIKDKQAEMYIPAVALIETALLIMKRTQEKEYPFLEEMPLMCFMNMRYWRRPSLSASSQRRVGTIPYF